MSNLGEKLKTIINDNMRKEADDLAMKKAREHQKLERCRMARESLIQNIDYRITANIMNGIVPRIKETDYDNIDWLNQAAAGRAQFQYLWDNLINKLTLQNLVIRLVFEHDGMGMQSWTVITVDPI